MFVLYAILIFFIHICLSLNFKVHLYFVLMCAVSARPARAAAVVKKSYAMEESEEEESESPSEEERV